MMNPLGDLFSWQSNKQTKKTPKLPNKQTKPLNY